MTKAKLRCFVAMPIGRADINRLFDRSIKPTLNEIGITPVFMGRLEHNDNVDQRIIVELKQCDLAIADLTYARPSVYYEAGFAERSVSTIYTCRRDHFRPRANDKYGNFKIHFDLITKNIVPWSSSEDGGFAGRLRKRIARVIAPMLRQQHRTLAERQNAEKFARLSLADRIACIRRVWVPAFRRAAYRRVQIHGNLAHNASFPWLFWKAQGKVLRLVGIRIQDNLTASDLREALGPLAWGVDLQFTLARSNQPEFSIGNVLIQKTRGIPGRVQKRAPKAEIHLIFCSFRNLPKPRIRTALPFFRLVETADAYSQWSRDSENVYVHIVDAIKSEASFSERISATLESVDA